MKFLMLAKLLIEVPPPEDFRATMRAVNERQGSVFSTHN